MSRSATKYPLFTARLLKERGWVADVVEPSGNIELAALTGLADGVVDVLAQSTARLIVNRQALKLERALLKPLIARLRQP